VIRVVLDTNVVVSALLRAASVPGAVLNLALDGIVQLGISKEILDEYEDVLRRPRLGIEPERAATAIRSLLEIGVLVEPAVRVEAATDPDDNIFLECAEEAQARYLVTGNVAHFPPRWAIAEIVTPRRFLEIITVERIEAARNPGEPN
jgi:putative PIN family toxin of toxin-antitoxin system